MAPNGAIFISGEEKMAVPESKTALLEAMEKSASALRKKLIAFGGHRLSAMPGRARGGSRMSVANLVSYLIGWGEQVLYWHQQEAAGEEVDFRQKALNGMNWEACAKILR